MIDALLTDMNSASQSYFQALAGNSPYGYGSGTGSIGGTSFSDYLSRISEANSEESRRILDYDRINYRVDSRDERAAFRSSPSDGGAEKLEAYRDQSMENTESTESTEKTAAEKDGRTYGLEQSEQKKQTEQSQQSEQKTSMTKTDDPSENAVDGKSGASDAEEAGKKAFSEPWKDKATGSKLVKRDDAPTAENSGKSAKTGGGKTTQSPGVLSGSPSGSPVGQGKGISGGDGDLAAGIGLEKNDSALSGRISDPAVRKKEAGIGEDNENLLNRMAAAQEAAAALTDGAVMKGAGKASAGTPSDRKSDSEKAALEADSGGLRKAEASVNAKESSDGTKLTIVDERSRRAAIDRHDGNADHSKNSGQSEGRPAGSVFQAKVDGAALSGLNEQNDSSVQVMQVHLRADSPQGTAAGEPRTAAQGDLPSQLAQQLKEQLNGEIVKRSSILIRNNGSGEIRLELKPEQLGNVRIRISLENNNIAGKILVENNSVKEAFDQNMQQLYRAFREHGFGDASLNVSVGDHRQRQQQDARTAAVHSGYRENLAVSIENGAGSVLRTDYESRLVDMLA